MALPKRLFLACGYTFLELTQLGLSLNQRLFTQFQHYGVDVKICEIGGLMPRYSNKVYISFLLPPTSSYNTF